MIRAVNQDDLRRSVFEGLGGSQAAKTSTNNYNAWGTLGHNHEVFCRV
jgi:hypothetical protein